MENFAENDDRTAVNSCRKRSFSAGIERKQEK
jgi:hypothetical protein